MVKLKKIKFTVVAKKEDFINENDYKIYMENLKKWRKRMGLLAKDGGENNG